MNFAVAGIVGVLAGICSGLFGIGGGIIIVPSLVLLLGFSQQKAQGTSLVALLLPVGILGVMNYAKAQQIDLRIGITLAVTLFAGVYFGSKLALNIPPIVMKRAFSGFLFVIATYLLWTTRTTT